MAVFTAIGAAIFGAGTFLAGLTAAGLQIAAGIAINLIAKANAGEPQAARFAVQGQVQTGDDVPRSINFGYNCTAGSKVYQNEWGLGGVYSTRVIALGDAPINSLVSVEVNGSPVTLDSTLTSMGYAALEFRKGGKDHLWIKFFDGTQTEADLFLIGDVSSADRPYTSARVGVGIPYVIATSLAPERIDGDEAPLFQGFPTFKFITNGVKLYDISKDSTAGGSGSQRWDYPSTWGGDGDFLPPVQIYNLLRGIRVSGQWLYGLQDVSAARLPQDNWVAQINKARAGIAGPSGTEATYRSGGEVQVGAPIHLAIEALLTSCQGRLTEVGGSYKIHVGEPDSSVMAFSDGDILSTEEQSFTPFFGLADTINGIAATYPNPSEGWNAKAAPSLFRPDLEAKDGNRRLMASVSLDMVPYPGQVQRLMKSALLEALRARRHTFVLGPEARVLEPGDVVEWTSVRNGYESKLFRVDGIVYKANLDVIVDITEVDPADYDWDQEADYTPVITGSLTLVGPRPMPMTGWQVFPDQFDDNDGNGRRPSIRVEYASGLSDARAVRVQVRLAGATALTFDGEIPYGSPWAVILNGTFLPNTNYEVRGIFVRASGAQSDWSDWLAVLTPNIKLGINDIDITFAEIAAEIVEDMKWISQGVRGALDNFERIGSLLSEQDLANFNDREVLRRELRKKTGDLEASFTEIIEVALGPDGAIAQSLSVLYAAMGGSSSQVNVRWEAQAGVAGYSARYALTAAVDDVSYRSASLLVDVPSDPLDPTRIVLAADQTVVANADGSAVFALFDENGLMVRDITSAMITSADGYSFWDLENNEQQWASGP